MGMHSVYIIRNGVTRHFERIGCWCQPTVDLLNNLKLLYLICNTFHASGHSSLASYAITVLATENADVNYPVPLHKTPVKLSCMDLAGL